MHPLVGVVFGQRVTVSPLTVGWVGVSSSRGDPTLELAENSAETGVAQTEGRRGLSVVRPYIGLTVLKPLNPGTDGIEQDARIQIV